MDIPQNPKPEVEPIAAPTAQATAASSGGGATANDPSAVNVEKPPVSQVVGTAAPDATPAGPALDIIVRQDGAQAGTGADAGMDGRAAAQEQKALTEKKPDSPSDDLSLLLNDAKLVALFAQRAGHLPDSSLLAAISQVTRNGTPSWSDDATLKLQAALNTAIAAMAPVTLLDLRRGWNPFERSKIKTLKSSLKNGLFLIFAGLLILSAAASTFILNKGSAIVIALETLKQKEPQRRIGQLQRQLLNAQPVSAAVTPETILAREAYFGTLDDLRDIDQRLNLYMPESQSFPVNYGNLFMVAKNELMGVGNKEIPKTGTNSAQGYASMNTSCELAKTAGNDNGSAFSKTEIGKMFIQYQADAFNLFCYQGLLYQPSMIPPIEARLSAVNQAIAVYALWILPAIYGALGATIFFMRSVLDPLTPDPPVSKIVLRVALGALAGIVLGWFWSPDNPLGSEIAKIGFSLFATSFIVGFSIDVFFAMLDRFVNLSRDFFTKIGAP